MLTTQEHNTLQFIRHYLAQYGYAPKFREIGLAIGVNSQGTVHRYVQSLQEKGYIDREKGNARGMSLVELLVTLGIVAVVGAVALPRINSGTLNAKVTAQNLLGDIRMARANATTRGAHFRVTLESTSYTVERLQDDDGDGDWEPGAGLQKRTVDLPSGISLSINNGDGIIEFTTRGLIATLADGTPPEIEDVTLNDSVHGKTRHIQVWPSGQVQEV